MTTPAEAQAAIRAHAVALPTEVANLNALPGAILHEDIVATRDHPPFDRVTMDGVAIASQSFAAGRREFRIAGTQAAGSPRLSLASTDTCFEVMTGAVVPQGCDCVVPIERVTMHDRVAKVADDFPARPYTNIHRAGLDRRAGERLIPRGTRIEAPELAVIAANGLVKARVARRPRIMVISTGDELVEPGTPAREWQIYRSNVFGVLTALQRRGYLDLAHDHLPDHLESMLSRLRSHLSTHDVLIMSGGVSMGRFDYVPRALNELGINMVFHTIEQRPGRPMWFGVGNGKTVYALPGNPVSTLMCLARYVYDGLDAAMGAAPRPVERVALAAKVEVKPALTLFMPVRLLSRSPEATVAQPQPTQGSGDFSSLIGTDGFVELPLGPRIVPAGTVVPLYRW